MVLKHLVPKPIRNWLRPLKSRAFVKVKKIGHRLGFGKLIWKLGQPSELGFWESYLGTRGKVWTRGTVSNAEEEFNFRICADSELQPWLKEWINSPEGSTLRVLDVGAGPLTYVGKKWGSRKIQIDAIDPLAESYDQIMDRYDIVPPVRTKKGDGEDVVSRFGKEVFDITFARNCLDHAYDAIKAVTNMIEATKPDGIVCLLHHPDEAEHAAYQGLHQWNFRLEKDDLIVCKGKKRLNVNQAFSKQLKILRCELKDNLIQTTYRKL